MEKCRQEAPPLINTGTEHFTRCFLYKEGKKA
jgi:hypothetical protein